MGHQLHGWLNAAPDRCADKIGNELRFIAALVIVALQSECTGVRS